jgi:hypothetical protein
MEKRHWGKNAMEDSEMAQSDTLSSPEATECTSQIVNKTAEIQQQARIQYRETRLLRLPRIW